MRVSVEDYTQKIPNAIQ